MAVKLKSADELKIMREAGQIVGQTLVGRHKRDQLSIGGQADLRNTFLRAEPALQIRLGGLYGYRRDTDPDNSR